MSPRHRIIIDTDPGVDDVLAILFALAARSDDLEILLISLTFGNVDVRSCLRNVLSIFHILEKELHWRKSQNRELRFEGTTKFSPLIALGADGPLCDTVESADYFHGRDGLAGTHETHPIFTPEDAWEKLWDEPPPESIITTTAKQETSLSKPTKLSNFTPSLRPGHEEILRILRENEPDTITIVSIGPLTTLAHAAAADPQIFLRCREVISMGGSINPGIGNVTPCAEFNVFADSYAAARIYALTSPIPSSTMPPPPLPDAKWLLPPYPPNLPKALKLTLMSLDITELHVLTQKQFENATKPLLQGDCPSPLATWMTAFMTPMFAKMERIGEGPQLALHDPMCIWYLLSSPDTRWKIEEEDIRVEVSGQWTRGMTIKDRRIRRRRNSDGEVPHDRGNWHGRESGNRVGRVVGGPRVEECAEAILSMVLGRKQEREFGESASMGALGAISTA